MAKIKPIEEHCHDYSAPALEGASTLLDFYIQKAKLATSLPELLEIQKGAAGCGLYNWYLEPISDNSDGRLANTVTFRPRKSGTDITELGPEDVYLGGNIKGLNTYPASFWEDQKDRNHDSYLTIFGQYKDYLVTVFQNIGLKIDRARDEAAEENNRSAIRNFLGGRNFPRPNRNITEPVRAYSAEAGFNTINDGALKLYQVTDAFSMDDFRKEHARELNIADNIAALMRNNNASSILLREKNGERINYPVIKSGSLEYVPTEIHLSENGLDVTFLFQEYPANGRPSSLSLLMKGDGTPHMLLGDSSLGRERELTHGNRNNWKEICSAILVKAEHALRTTPENVTEKTDPLEYIKGRGYTMVQEFEKDPKNPGRDLPKGYPCRAYIADKRMTFTTSFGQTERVMKGDYLIQDPANPEDVFGYSKAEFDKRFRIADKEVNEEIRKEEKPAESAQKEEEQKPAVSSAPKISKSNAAALGKQHKDILCRTLDAAAGEKIFATPVIIDGEGHQLPKEDGVSCSLMRSFYEDWLPDMLTINEIHELGCDIVSPDVKPYLCKGVAHSDGTIGTQLRYNLADTTFPEQQPEVYKRFCEYRRNEEKAMCSDFYRGQKGVLDAIGMNEIMAREILDRYPQYEEYKQYIKTILYHNIAANLGEESLCGNFRPRTGITLPDDQTAYKIHRAVGVYLEDRYEGTSRRKEFAPAKGVINTIKNTLQEQKNEAMRRCINGPEQGQGKGKGIK